MKKEIKKLYFSFPPRSNLVYQSRKKGNRKIKKEKVREMGLQMA